MQNSCLKTSAWWSRGSHFVENGYLSLRFPNMVKVNIHEHWKRVTRFNPLWVSGTSWSASPIAWIMSLNLQLFLLFLITTLRYGFLGFTLSMFLDVLIIIFVNSSLHNRRFMIQARRTQHFERSAKRARSVRQGEEKNEAPVTSPFFWLFRPPTPISMD